MWNCGGKLCVLYYLAGQRFASYNGNTQQGTGAIAFFVGDVDNDKRADVVHVWNCNGKVCIMHYPAANGFNYAHNVNTGQGTGAVAWLSGDFDGDGLIDIAQ